MVGPMMQRVSALVSTDIGDYLTNVKTWGMMYNVLENGLVGDGTTDDTAALQALINKAIAAGRRTIFFPHTPSGGRYYVTALTNASQVDFIGDNCTFVGGYTGTITNLGAPAVLQADIAKRRNGQDRFRVLSQDPTKEQAITIIGDSISDGYNATDFQNDSWVGIVRKAINIDSGNKNYGYESFSLDPSKNNYQTLESFNFGSYFDPTAYGGTRASSSTLGAYLTSTFVGKDCKLVYVARADGGVINVTVDGAPWGAINTSVIGPYPSGTISTAITTLSWGKHVIKLEKADTKPTDLCGMMFYENASIIQPIVHNVSRNAISCSEIPDSVFDQYVDNDMLIWALGVNDEIHNYPIDIFRYKIGYVASKVANNKGSMIIIDFMFSSPPTSLYKQALKDLSDRFPQFNYIDFAQIWFGDQAKNIESGLLDPDGLHPTNAGHEQIAQVLLNHMNLPYSKRMVSFVPDSQFEPIPLANGWTAFGGGFEAPGYRLYPDGKLKLRGLLKPGTLAMGTIVAYLPLGRRPKMNRIFAVSTNGAYAEVKIFSTDGSIVLSTGTVTAFLCLDNVIMEVD